MGCRVPRDPAQSQSSSPQGRKRQQHGSYVMPGSEVTPTYTPTQHKPWRGRANTCAPLSSASLCPVSLWSPHRWHGNQHPWDEGFGSPHRHHTQRAECCSWGRGGGGRLGEGAGEFGPGEQDPQVWVIGRKGGKDSEVCAGPGA